MVQNMNTHAPNPFTGLKGTLDGLMSGGLLGLLLSLLFRRRIGPMLAALENLFAQFQAGALAPPALALTLPAAAPAPPAGKQTAAPRRRPPVRRKPIPRAGAAAAAAPAPVVAWYGADAPRRPASIPRPQNPSRRSARCRKNRSSKPRLATP